MNGTSVKVCTDGIKEFLTLKSDCESVILRKYISQTKNQSPGVKRAIQLTESDSRLIKNIDKMNKLLITLLKTCIEEGQRDIPDDLLPYLVLKSSFTAATTVPVQSKITKQTSIADVLKPAPLVQVKKEVKEVKKEATPVSIKTFTPATESVKSGSMETEYSTPNSPTPSDVDLLNPEQSMIVGDEKLVPIRDKIVTIPSRVAPSTPYRTLADLMRERNNRYAQKMSGSSKQAPKQQQSLADMMRRPTEYINGLKLNLDPEDKAYAQSWVLDRPDTPRCRYLLDREKSGSISESAEKKKGISCMRGRPKLSEEERADIYNFVSRFRKTYVLKRIFEFVRQKYGVEEKKTLKDLMKAVESRNSFKEAPRQYIYRYITPEQERKVVDDYTKAIDNCRSTGVQPLSIKQLSKRYRLGKAVVRSALVRNNVKIVNSKEIRELRLQSRGLEYEPFARNSRSDDKGSGQKSNPFGIYNLRGAKNDGKGSKQEVPNDESGIKKEIKQEEEDEDEEEEEEDIEQFSEDEYDEDSDIDAGPYNNADTESPHQYPTSDKPAAAGIDFSALTNSVAGEENMGNTSYDSSMQVDKTPAYESAGEGLHHGAGNTSTYYNPGQGHIHHEHAQPQQSEWSVHANNTDFQPDFSQNY